MNEEKAKRETRTIDIGFSDPPGPPPAAPPTKDEKPDLGKRFIKDFNRRKGGFEYKKKREKDMKIASNILFEAESEHGPQSEEISKEMWEMIQKDIKVLEDSVSIPFCHRVKPIDGNVHQKFGLHESPETDCTRKHIISPFRLKNFFGFNAQVFAKNMTRAVEFAVLVVTGNLVLIYDYNAEQHYELAGHRNRVVSTAIDAKGKWIATSDMGPDCSVIIWDAARCFPVHIIWEFNKTGCFFVKLSPCAKYLITVVEKIDHQNIKLLSIWEWVHGCDKADVSVEIDTDEYGALKRIDICHACCEFIMVTTEKHVIFLTFENINSQKYLTVYNPRGITKKIRKEFGILNDSIYVKASHMAVTGTTTGQVLIWSDKPWNFFEEEPRRPPCNRKNLFIQMKVDRYSIESIYSVDGQIVTLNSRGMILFYDLRFHLLYAIKELRGCSQAVNLCFHIKKRSYEGSSLNFDDDFCSVDSGINIIKSEKIVEWEKLRKEDHCLGNPDKLFEIRDFIATTSTGDVVYVNHTHDQVKFILRNQLVGVTAIEANPQSNFLCIGTDHGKLILFEYIIGEITHCVSLPILEAATLELGRVDEDDRETIEVMSYVTYLKYCSSGSYVACGMKSGDIWLVDGSNLNAIARIPKTAYPIEKIVFSKMNDYFAYYDSYSHMILMSNKDEEPVYIGKIRAHSKPISDIAFTSKDDQHYLYSVGLDNVFVEYAVNECDKLGILKINVYFTLALLEHVVCLFPDPSSRVTMLMFSNTGKCRYIDLEKMHIYQTVQAPMLQTAVRQVEQLDLRNQSEFLLFVCQREIGLLRCPVDGNPFKWISHATTSEQIEQFTISRDGKYVFCKGKNEYITMWEVNTMPVNALEALGGIGADPYVTLLSIDPRSTTIEDIQDLFFYCQIAHKGCFSAKPYPTSNTIGACDMASAFRALGYFMTDFEEKLLIDELVGESGLKLTEIEVTYEKFIITFVNHKVSRVSEPVMKRAFCDLFETIMPPNVSIGKEVPGVLLEDFIRFLEKFGDAFTPCMTYIYLRSLIKPFTKDTEADLLKKIEVAKEFPYINNKYYDFIPKVITYDYFKAVIMGLKDDFNVTLELDDRPIFYAD